MYKRLLKLKNEAKLLEREEQKLLGSLESQLESFRKLLGASEETPAEELLKMADNKVKKLKRKYRKLDEEFKEEVKKVKKIQKRLRGKND